MNDFSHQPDDSLRRTGDLIAGQLAKGGVPLDPALIERVVAASAAYEADVQAVLAARSAFRGAVAEKDASRGALVAALGEAWARLVRDESVTDAELMGAGFAPRPPRAPRPTPAARVQGLTLRVGERGDLVLAWRRGANGRSTVFQIETAKGGPFVLRTSTTRTRHVLRGHPYGREIRVRVVATTSTTRALPSSEVMAYLGVVARAA